MPRPIFKEYETDADGPFTTALRSCSRKSQHQGPHHPASEGPVKPVAWGGLGPLAVTGPGSSRLGIGLFMKNKDNFKSGFNSPKAAQPSIHTEAYEWKRSSESLRLRANCKTFIEK